MKRFLLIYVIAIFILAGTCANAFNTYTWNVAVGCFTSAGSWTPARTAPAADDALIFDGTTFTMCTATSVFTSTIGQLKIINNCTASFTQLAAPAATQTLTIGAAGMVPALLVDTNCQLRLVTLTPANCGIVIVLQTYSLGTVNGDVILSMQNNASHSRFTAQTTGGIVFTNGATFQNAPFGATNNDPMFGNVAINKESIVFQSGATYYEAGTKTGMSSAFGCGDPFILAYPASVVKFLPGSTYYVWNLVSFATFSGRTVGNLIMDNRGARSNMPGNNTSPIVIQNDLVFKGLATGQVYANSAGGGWKILGNFIVESGSAGFDDNYGNNSLNNPFEVLGNFTCAGTFSPCTGGTVGLKFGLNRCYILSGSSPQTLMLNSNSLPLSNLSVNNASGINMLSDVAVSSTLYMGAGNINTNGYTLSLGSTSGPAGFGNLVRTSGTVNGNLSRWIYNSTGAYLFPVGTNTNYNGATVNFTSAPTAGWLTTFFTASNPGTSGVPLNDGITLSKIAPEGFWSVQPGAVTGGQFSFTGIANGFSLPAVASDARIVNRTDGVSPWTVQGSAGTNSGVNVVRTAVPVYGDFGIALSAPIAGFTASPTSGDGPLLVTFIDTSLYAPTSWAWDFGDGGTDSNASTQHTYGTVAAPTTYTARLIVSDGISSSTATQNISVTEPAPSVPNPIAPLDNLTTLNGALLFSWTTSTDVVSSSMNYTLQLAKDAGFSSIINTIASIASTQYSISNLPTGPVYWHVLGTSLFGSSAFGSSQLLFIYDTVDQQVVASSQTVTFYLGDSTGYFPLTAIFNTTDADTVTVLNFDQKAPSLPTTYYISRYWKIDRVGNSTLNVDLTFSYSLSDFSDSGVSTESDLFPARDTTGSGAWSSYLTGVTPDLPNHRITVTGVTDFSPWTVGGPDGAVPVELSNFKSE